MVDPNSDTLFEFDPRSGSQYSTLRVYHFGTTALVFQLDNIIGGEVVVPAGTFEPGHRYEWRVTVFNPVGYWNTDFDSFTTRCLADWNEDGAISFFDTADFLADFHAMYPRADLAEPQGVWDFFDVLAFQAIQGAGCP